MKMKPGEPDNAELRELNERAIELADRGELEAAEQIFRRAADAGSLASLFNLGRLLGLVGRPREAFEMFREGARRDDPIALLQYGNLLHDEMGDAPAAIEAYRRAIALGSIDAYVSMGAVFEAEGDSERARTAYEAAIGLGDRAANWQLAELLVEIGEESSAEPAYREAIDGGEERAHLGLAFLLKDDGRLVAAESHFRRAAASKVEGAHAALG